VIIIGRFWVITEDRRHWTKPLRGISVAGSI
jgi:hypothetical protein